MTPEMITKVTECALAVIVLLVSAYLIPWLKDKLTNNQYNALKGLVRVGVFAAEQIFTSEQWKEKKQYVLDFLKQNGYEIDAPAVDALIEATVRELRIEQGQRKDAAVTKLIEQKTEGQADE